MLAAKIGDGVVPLPLGARDLVAGGVLLALQPLDLGDQPAAARFERRDLLQIGVRIEAAVAQAGPDVVDVIAHERGIKHPIRSYTGAGQTFTRTVIRLEPRLESLSTIRATWR